MGYLTELYQPVAMTGAMSLALIVLSIWMTIWKGLGMWHAARYKQKWWFIAILVLNTLGILPIIYLIWFRPKEEVREAKVEGLKAIKIIKKKKK